MGEEILKYFHTKNNSAKKIEKGVDEGISKFLEIIKENSKLKKYISVFGIVGPAARAEGFYFDEKNRSDIDFYVITNYIDVKEEKLLKNKFEECFNKKLDCSLLIASNRVLKKPDLMLYEFSNSGKILYGKIKKLNINELSKFEGFRNIIYRGKHFLNLLSLKEGKLVYASSDKTKFLYNYSKVIFAAGEIELMLNKKYVANNFERNKLIKKSKLAKEHKEMFDFRYKKIIPKGFNYEKYIIKAFEIINYSYNKLFEEIPEEEFKKINPEAITAIVNRLIFIKDYLFKYKRMNIQIKDPFINLSIMFYNLSKKIVNKEKISEKEFNKIIKYSETAGWFYYKIK